MTTDTDLARRLVACRSWGWRSRMRTRHGETVIAVHPERGLLVVDGDHGPSDPLDCDPQWVRPDDGGPRVPDLSDGATRGVCLDLLRKALGEPTLHLRPCSKDAPDEWEVVVCVERLDAAGMYEWLREDGSWGAGDALAITPDTEAHAIVLAFEAADRRGP
jgi:ribosomal protein L34